MLHHLTSRYVNDGFYPDTYGEMTGALSIEVSSNNYSYNKGGGIDIDPAQWSDTNVNYNNYGQSIRISNNILQYNGDGWAIRILDFGQFPLLVNNDFYGSKYGVFLQAIDFIGAFPRVKMEFTE
nr:hypothetical protein [Thermoplasmata archaeon]NIS13303.1 hypothetical protein [Thermoplasmata archaeon]NIS21201.1 hypothetical protein [Thermoplasmata archaeon]NIT78695.1 hypothetical protein [Thermoplasmata archaeon]NIU50255.1 hypothetical protein [Thermoplasmata archaeon]